MLPADSDILDRMTNELPDRKYLLVVDDEPRFRFALKTCLETRYEVETAGDGQEALRVLSRRMPDLIVLDLSMPGMGGKDFARELKNRLGKAMPPIIVQTAHADPETVVSMATLGASSYFLKPVAIEELEKKIADLLDPNHSRESLGRVRLAEKWAASEPPWEALGRMGELVELDPVNPALRLIAAKICLLLGEHGQARYHAQVAAASREGEKPAELILALCALASGERKNADFHARRAVALIQEHSDG